MTKPLTQEQGVKELQLAIDHLMRLDLASQRMLARVTRENRVRDECLEIAMEMLRYYAKLKFAVHAAQKTVDEIEQRLAELEPETEEETG